MIMEKKFHAGFSLEKTNLIRTVIIISGFSVYFLLLMFFDFHKVLIRPIKPDYVRSLCFHLICLVPVVVSLFLLFKPKNILDSLGLGRGFFTGVAIAFLCTLPMFMGSMLSGSLNPEITANDIFRKIIFAGFFEELVFRGFLFGLLFRYAKWGFIPAALIGALFFGIGHLYQGNDILSALGSFGVTALGAIWFSWMYAEWRYNLWLPVSIHVFMNASWILFSVSSTAVGDAYINIFRALTIVAIIIVTIIYKRWNHQPYFVNKKTLWKN